MRMVLGTVSQEDDVGPTNVVVARALLREIHAWSAIPVFFFFGTC